MARLLVVVKVREHAGVHVDEIGQSASSMLEYRITIRGAPQLPTARKPP
jgi:hypothetical protein